MTGADLAQLLDHGDGHHALHQRLHYHAAALTVAIPKLEELNKQGEEGRKKIAQITRYVTVGLGFLPGRGA